MADHIPHDGGSPRVEDEPDIMLLPPRIQPFDLERYHPQEHIFPPSTFHHFTDFAQRAPTALLLRELESHLAHHAREVRTSLLHFLRCILHFLHTSCFRYVFYQLDLNTFTYTTLLLILNTAHTLHFVRSEHIYIHSASAHSEHNSKHSILFIWHTAHT